MEWFCILHKNRRRGMLDSWFCMPCGILTSPLSLDAWNTSIPWERYLSSYFMLRRKQTVTQWLALLSLWPLGVMNGAKFLIHISKQLSQLFYLMILGDFHIHALLVGCSSVFHGCHDSQVSVSANFIRVGQMLECMFCSGQEEGDICGLGNSK